MKKLLLALAFMAGLAGSASAQITVPNTLVAGTTITSSGLNTNFSTIANHALDRLSGGDITGSITLESTAKLTELNTASDSIKTSGGITAGSGVVGIVGTDGRIPAITSTYFASLDGSNLINLNATNIASGTLNNSRLSGVALLGSVNAFTARNDLYTYTEPKASPTISTNVLTLDLSTAEHFVVALNANISTLTISNTPATANSVTAFTIKFTADGTLRTITWPASVHWPGGSAPTMTSTNTKVDVFTFISYDNGTTWYAFNSGQSF